MDKLDLKYGCNPNQGQASISVDEGRLPVKVLNGRPGYINLLDALNGWQLVRELKSATGLAAATSFKHVSPAGAAVALELDETERKPRRPLPLNHQWWKLRHRQPHQHERIHLPQV